MRSVARRLLESAVARPSAAERYHVATKVRRVTPQPAAEEVPSSWVTIHFKTYPRLPWYALSSAPKASSTLLQCVRARRSTREFTGAPVTAAQLSDLITLCARSDEDATRWGDHHRPYPSAGARYPLELYVMILKSEELAPGLYHYNAKRHGLEQLLAARLVPKLRAIFGSEGWITSASVIVVVTGVLGRIETKYGDRGYRYMLIECGHLCQNICLAAGEFGLSVCPIGGFADDRLCGLLDISLQRELPLYSIVIGEPACPV